jgi:hypothetical protein
MKPHGYSALALLAFGAQSCGARSGLEVTSGIANVAPSTEDGSPGNLAGPVLCALNAGPVALCAPTSQSGPIQVSDSNFPACVQPSGFSQWACCTGGEGPYDGPSGDCRFPGPLSPGCPATGSSGG